MKEISRIQLLVIFLALSSTVLLSLASTTSSGGKAPKMMQMPEGQGKSLDEQVAEARKNLKPDLTARLNAIESSISTNRDPIERGHMYDSLSKYLGQNKEYVLAAY